MIHPLFAIIDAPIIIGIVVIGALLFGADKLPKLARSAGEAKKEFMMGQIEADEAAAKARDDLARTRAASTPGQAPMPSAEPPNEKGDVPSA